ncbi:MAG: DEAD/DEAH box helicase [Deltaproteobacteria bacterium]|nr:DEAD/DEAH box helicase [Deltaproteobacteria bacterium]
MNPGTIVRCRNRDWVLLPSERSEILLLRPLTGAIDDVVAVHRGLANIVGASLPEERVRPATFPLPTEDDLSDAAGAHLLWQAARLTLREGATPFRSLGRVSIRPRVYQFVPLLMALRLDLVRLLVADDVGVGKTIEALLIAREMLDRGEIKRMCVLCPPYLCEQWQKELSEKFNLDAVIVRSGTVNQLDRRKTGTGSIYKYYPVQVASIDFVKTEHNKDLFLLDCPEMVILDEAHGAAAATEDNKARQQRHQLISQLASKESQHLVMLTATPHSGIETAFRSLLALLQPKFGGWDAAALTEPQRVELARHFVQRTRADIVKEWEGEHCFPARDPSDETYRLSKAYHQLFSKTYDFCSELVRIGKGLDRRQQRVRYWGALSLLRCVMSSPAAAAAALVTRHDALAVSGDEPDFRSLVFESGDERTDDNQPTAAVEQAERTLPETDRRQLRELGRLAKAIHGTQDDTKLGRCAEIVAGLLKEGFSPIVWCRYIATAEYVAEGLSERLRRAVPGIRVVAVTGLIGDDEREAKIAEIDASAPRVLVATDCLSEGVNLQEKFNAVLHYDLPWNPNRLEQREGRVDRFGQRAKVVKAIRYFGPDNKIDGVVIDVLLNKAREIHRALGTHVPVPEESETVTEAVLNALFMRGKSADTRQLEFDLGSAVPEVGALHKRWERDAEREKVNRTRFAQRAIKPDEVKKELEATDSVLGDPGAVKDFVLNAAQRVGLSVSADKRPGTYRIVTGPEGTATLPEALGLVLPKPAGGKWFVSFDSPTPEGAEYLGRNHRFVAALAAYLMEDAIERHGNAAASRCGVIGTRAVSRLTTIFLLRSRYLVEQPARTPMLAEEVLVAGVVPGRRAGQHEWLTEGEALRLLAEARPDANVPMNEKRELAGLALGEWPGIQGALKARIEARAQELEKSHKRVRQAVSMRVKELAVRPQPPPDLLGLLVLQPGSCTK